MPRPIIVAAYDWQTARVGLAQRRAQRALAKSQHRMAISTFVTGGAPASEEDDQARKAQLEAKQAGVDKMEAERKAEIEAKRKQEEEAKEAAAKLEKEKAAERKKAADEQREKARLEREAKEKAGAEEAAKAAAIEAEKAAARKKAAEAREKKLQEDKEKEELHGLPGGSERP